LTYTITVANRGPDPAPDVRVIDTPKAPIRLVSARPERGSCQIGPPTKCRLGTLAPGARVTVTITAVATTVEQQVNDAAAINGSWDPDPATSIALAGTTIIAAHPPSFTG
jgi:hypothetical protein